MTEPTNEDRAEWARKALATFMLTTGSESEDAVCDLLADLMHYCRLNEIDFEDELRKGLVHFEAEVSEEEEAS